MVSALLDSFVRRADECDVMELCLEAQADAVQGGGAPAHATHEGTGREKRALRWVRLARSTLFATQVGLRSVQGLSGRSNMG